MSFNPRDTVIVDCARSAMGRSKNGCFRKGIGLGLGITPVIERVQEPVGLLSSQR